MLVSITVDHHGEFLLSALRRVLFIVFFVFYFIHVEVLQFDLLVGVELGEHLHPLLRKRVGVVESFIREIDVVVVVQVQVGCLLLSLVSH